MAYPPDPHPNGTEPFMTVREMVTEIRTDMKELRQEVALKETTDRQDARISRVEKWMYGLPLTGLLAVGGLITALVR